MDFVEGLPNSKGEDVIMVVVDRFIEYSHFIPLSHPYTILSVAQAFVDNIIKLHGPPKMTISDRDRIFTSKLWKKVFTKMGVKLHMSTSYHPQTDGQTERVNQCIETFLRCFTHACPRRWSFWIPLAQFWYNSSPHSAIGMSPFKALYGHEPHHFGLSAEGTI